MADLPVQERIRAVLVLKYSPRVRQWALLLAESLAELDRLQAERDRLEDSKRALIDKVKRLEDRVAVVYREATETARRASQAERDTLADAASALRRLVALKDGPLRNQAYIDAKPIAWAEARSALAAIDKATA